MRSIGRGQRGILGEGKRFGRKKKWKCSNDILLSLGHIYAGGGEFTASIDRAGGTGTADFTAEAIRIYCGK